MLLPAIETIMHRPRVLLAEDHAETAERLRKLLVTEFDVIAWVEDGAALVDAAARLSPDVIVDRHRHAWHGRHRSHGAGPPRETPTPGSCS